MKFKDELFSPYIFLIGFIIFCIIGLTGKNYFGEYYKSGISFYTVSYIFLIISAFIVGSKINLNIKENYLAGIILFLVVFFTFKRFGYYSIILSLLALMIIIMVKKNYFSIYYKEMYIIGLLLCFLNILILGKLPLLNPEIRELSLTPLFVLGYTFVLVSNNFGILKSKYPYYLIFPIVSLLLFILYGFRTYVILLIISTMITFYQVGNKQKTFYFGLVGSIITIVLGYITVLLLPQNWKLNPFELLWYRFTFTF
ncbi:MAG: hypothetical protein GKC00_07860, partial [Candidatus Methanofastidiosa archaeon]|nr:hypothetical protein [Candidatus Methanofastidiosa archaeon]